MVVLLSSVDRGSRFKIFPPDNLIRYERSSLDARGGEKLPAR